MRLAIWSTTTPRDANGNVPRELEEVELAECIGINQIWFFEHHLQRTAPVPSPNFADHRRRAVDAPYPVCRHGQYSAVPLSDARRRGGGDARQSDPRAPRYGSRPWSAPLGIRGVQRQSSAVARDVP